MFTSQRLTVILFSTIWFCFFEESSSAGQVLLSSNARDALTSRGSTCPTDNQTFTCTGRNLSSNTIRWYINSNQASSYTLTTSPPPPYPITVNSIGTDIEVIVVNAQVDNGMFTFINTTLTTRVDYITPNSIGCGTFKVIDKIKLSCSPPAPFLVEPSDKTCDINSNVIFRCKPSKKGVNITWNINEKFIVSNSSNFTTKYIDEESQLHVTGCSLDWNGYIVKCVIRTATRDIYSNSSILTVEDANSQTLDFLGDHVGEIVAFLCGVVVSGVITMLLVCSICFCCRRFCCTAKQDQDEDVVSPPVNYERYRTFELREGIDTDHLERDQERIKIDQKEINAAREAAKNHLPERYKHVRDLPELGKRLQKYWFLVHDTHEKRDLILTRAPVSKKCELTLDKHGHLKTLNRMLRELRARNHFLLNAEDIMLDPSDPNFIFIFQPLMEKGSLKDLIYRTADLITNPGKQSVVDIGWEDKYKGRGHLLSADQVSQYGRQILEGITFLYDLGFSPLGHIQTGNIFVDGDTCRLGGYENMLLGYSTRLHKTIAEKNSSLSPQIDIIAFGHVIYEMSAGRDLMGIIPSEEDYKDVGDENCKEILKYIFTLREDGQLKHTIPKILKHPFFKHKQHMYWTEGMKDVLNLAGRRRVVVGGAEGKTSTGISLEGVVKGITARFKARKSSDLDEYALMENDQEDGVV